MIANEKRRRRRESHNAVERRRRDNINEKISELATLIPECLLDPNASITMPPLTSPSEELLFGTPNGNANGNGTTNAIGNANGNATASGSANGSVGTDGAKVKDGSVEPEDGGSPGASAQNGGQGGGEGAVKANKGMILRKSVDYIR